MSKVKMVKEGIDLNDVNPQKLTSDCMVVHRNDGSFDVVKAYKMVDIFDWYYDMGILLKRIELSGGVLNPKMQSPCL